MDILLIPQSLLGRLRLSPGDARHLNGLLSLALLVAVFITPAVFHYVVATPHFCLFEHFLDIPCPGCDITTALAALMQANVHRSFTIQPCALLLVMALFLQTSVRIAYFSRLLGFRMSNQLISYFELIFVVCLMYFWLFRLSNNF